MYIIRQKRGSKVSISEMSNSSKRLWQEKKTLETVRCPEVKKKKNNPNAANCQVGMTESYLEKQRGKHSLTGQFYQRNDMRKTAFTDFDESA